MGRPNFFENFNFDPSFGGGSVNQQLSPKVLFALTLTLALDFTSLNSSASAGECKVKSPSDGMIADAMKMQVVAELQIERLALAYKKETGKDLKVILVSRAGQNFKDLQVLKDVDSRGRVLTPQRMIELAEAKIPVDADRGTRDAYQVGQQVVSSFSDRQRSMKYSHMGILLRNHPSGRDENGRQEYWWFRHQLRPCVDENQKKEGMDYNKPLLWDEGMGRFFSDDPHELRAQLVVLRPEIQDRVEALVMSSRSALSFNGEFYNAVASWTNPIEQNSNQWVLEIAAAALRPLGQVMNRRQAQQVLKETGYRPTTVAFWGKQRLALLPGASLLVPYVKIRSSEQPFAHAYQIGEVISTMSIVEFLSRQGVLQWAPLELHIAERLSQSQP